MRTINQWPHSQICIGCCFGEFKDDPEKYGSSAYECKKHLFPDGKGPELCSEKRSEENIRPHTEK